MNAVKSSFNLLSLSGKFRILNLTWFAFFLTFVVWFNHAPLLATIRETFGLSDQEVKILLILNVALTIPARVIIGMLVDRFGRALFFRHCCSFPALSVLSLLRHNALKHWQLPVLC